MGTRNLTCVVLDGEYRVAQYGQWDGYPTGQGDTVVSFLLGNDLDRFRDQIRKTKMLTKAEAQAMLRPDDKTCHVSRDMGAGILQHVQDAKEPSAFSQIDFAADSLFCEWAYVVNLDRNVLEVYQGFNKTPLSKTDRFYCLRDKRQNEYHPIRLFAEVPFKDLTDSTMIGLETRAAKEAESES